MKMRQIFCERIPPLDEGVSPCSNEPVELYSFLIGAPLFIFDNLTNGSQDLKIESRQSVNGPMVPEFYLPEKWHKQYEIALKEQEGYRLPDFPIKIMEHSLYCYRELLRSGISHKQALCVLPQSLIMWFTWSGPLQAWLDHFNYIEKHPRYDETTLVIDHLRNQLPHKELYV